VVQEFAQTSEEYQALLDRKVDAVVQGSVGLNYHASHEGKGLVKMVCPEFNKNDVGFVFPLDSPLRKKVNITLLSMREDGTYQRIYDKWFGAR
jgi:polar amino acid transport system substrate-binding protein